MGRKHAEFQEMMEATRAIQNAGIVVNACFIVGVDGETQASIDALGDFLCTAPFGEVQLTLQTPFPGTGLFRKLQHAGRLIERFDGDATDWSRHTLFDVTFHPDEMTAIDLQASFAALIARVFSGKQQIRRNQLARAIRSRRRIRSRRSLGTNRSHRGAQR